MFTLKRSIFSLIVCCSLLNLSHANQDIAEDRTLYFHNYFVALQKVSSPDASEEDINTFKSFFADDFVSFHTNTSAKGPSLQLTKKMFFDSLQKQRALFTQINLLNFSMYAGNNMGMLLYEQSFVKANTHEKPINQVKQIVVEVLKIDKDKVIASNKFIEVKIN